MELINIILLASLFLCFAVQMFYFLYYYARPAIYRKRTEKEDIPFPDNTPGVSVIISAKNESQNLAGFLPLVLEQNYPCYEVIVVNDGSTDESEDVLGRFENQYKHLYKTYIPEGAKYISRKKLALTVGIKAAKYDWLLFTEASSEPLSKDWIRSMSRNFDEKTEVVLGFSTFNRWGRGSLFANFDNLLNGLRYLSCAIMKRPYMGVGNNLAYRKDLFFAKKGFSKRLNLRAGDDDLFVNEVANGSNTKVEISENANVMTHIESFKMWKEMKISSAATKRYYKGNQVALWRVEYLTRYLFLAFSVLSCVFYWKTLYVPCFVFSMLLLRYLTIFFVINRSAKIFHLDRFYFSILLFDLLQPLMDFRFYFERIIRGKYDYTWR